jgi:hypothetical protein
MTTKESDPKVKNKIKYIFSLRILLCSMTKPNLVNHIFSKKEDIQQCHHENMKRNSGKFPNYSMYNIAIHP